MGSFEEDIFESFLSVCEVNEYVLSAEDGFFV